jgi:hypothetical protein
MQYFAGRVVSREALQKDEKRLECLFVDPAVVLILDDRFDVWTAHLENLILAPRYEVRGSH